MRRGLGISWITLNVPASESLGVPEGEEEEIENLFENITKENFLNLAKEIDFRKFRKLRESQRSWIQGSTHQGTS